jgi:restriction endonuclease
MDEESQKIIEEQMKKLPEDVKQAIISVDYKTRLQEITQRQKLLIDKAWKLEMETTLVMIGLEPITDYIDNLQREMELPLVRAREVAMDVDEHIFKPIRVSLQKMNEGLKSAEEKVPNGATANEEIDLDRNQVLNEIENPEMIRDGNQSMNFKSEVPKQAKTTTIEIKPAQEIETIPGQGVKDVARNTSMDILTAKMTGATTTSQQIINTKPESKLPEIKKRPSGGVDPYREEIK